ncbi:MAG TPA: serine/threonine-protein kinase [Polyangiales bacterium]|nr:serine/threonine-protein kinase [Polyangiales bacterium]
MRLPTRGTKVAEKYQLVEEIGRGGMGVVWRAYAESLGLHCALKMVLPGFGAERERARLLREARTAAKLRSPYIVNTYDVGEWEGGAFIAMELLEGEPLSKVLEDAGTFTPAFTCELMRQLALGLEKAHAAGLVHRDLKPDNIFVVEREPLLVKLLDFGIAKRLSVETDSTQMQSMEGAVIGTPRYMSPEQARGAAELDFRSDLWSLAVIAFECLTGTLPFDGDTWPHLLVNVCTAPLPIPSQRCATVPAGFDAFWQSAAARDPALRPASVRAFADQLRQALIETPGKLVPPAHAVEGAPRRNHLWVAAALAGVAAASGGSAYLLGQRANREPEALIVVQADLPATPQLSRTIAAPQAALDAAAPAGPQPTAAAVATQAAIAVTTPTAAQPSAAAVPAVNAQAQRKANKPIDEVSPDRAQAALPQAKTAVDDELGF